MAMVVSGDFEPEKLLEEIKKRLIDFCKTFLRDDLKIESMADICS